MGRGYSPHTADILSLAFCAFSLFVHSGESRTDILEVLRLEGAGSRQQGSSIFYLSPAVTTIPALRVP